MIKCENCGRNFKAKKERGIRKYVCSSYDNYGECQRTVIDQSFIIELLKRRYGEGFEFSKSNIKQTVESIIVKDKYEFTINLYNDKPIILTATYIQY